MAVDSLVSVQNISRDKVRSLAFFSSAISYQDKGLNEAALDNFSKAIELSPDESIFYLVRGSVYDLQGLHQEAIDDYSYGIELSPDEPVFYLSRAKVYEENGYAEEASADYQRFQFLDIP